MVTNSRQVIVSQQQLLVKARHDHGLTLQGLADLFGCTKQHIYQVEQGITNLSTDRIKFLAENAKAPEWARSLAFRLWFLNVTDDHAEISAQLEDIGRIILPRNGAKRA